MPCYALGPNLSFLIKANLIEKVQGTVTEKYGYVVCVLKVEEIGPGKVVDTSGDVLFFIKYKAIIMKPFVGEVCDGLVTMVEKHGVHVEVGPMKVFISKGLFPPDYVFDETSSSFIGETIDDKVGMNSEVRFKIQGLNFERKEFYATGTMAENYLGPIS